MEPIKLLYKNYKNISIKEMHQYGEQVLQKKEILKKNTRIWIDAWEELPWRAFHSWFLSYFISKLSVTNIEDKDLSSFTYGRG